MTAQTMGEERVELLPCPFCGGEASYSQYETESLWSHDQVTYTQVGCDECSYHIDTEPGFELEALDRWNTRAPVALPLTGEVAEMGVERAALRRIAEGNLGDLPWQANYERIRQVAAEALTAHPAGVTEAIEAPANGETDPEWAAIRRTIDYFVGRVPTVGRHRAVNTAHIQNVVARLDEAGDREAGDTIVWLCWHRALDRERERFLLADKDEQLAEARQATPTWSEAIEAAAKVASGNVDGCFATGQRIATAIRNLSPKAAE